jgi:hypothetical protein
MSHSKFLSAIINDDVDDFDMIEFVKLKRQEREERKREMVVKLSSSFISFNDILHTFFIESVLTGADFTGADLLFLLYNLFLPSRYFQNSRQYMLQQKNKKYKPRKTYLKKNPKMSNW